VCVICHIEKGGGEPLHEEEGWYGEYGLGEYDSIISMIVLVLV
jgi:hypothetical protein